MEGLRNNQRSTGRTLSNDPEMRLPSRPALSQTDSAFLDLGQTHPSAKELQDSIGQDASFDELDILSSIQFYEDERGDKHPFDQKYLPKKMPTGRIPKKKNVDGDVLYAGFSKQSPKKVILPQKATSLQKLTSRSKTEPISRTTTKTFELHDDESDSKYRCSKKSAASTTTKSSRITKGKLTEVPSQSKKSSQPAFPILSPVRTSNSSGFPDISPIMKENKEPFKKQKEKSLSRSPPPRKRYSDEADSDRDSKKSKQDEDPDISSNLLDDSFFAPADPNTLCPFCDQRLPPNPSTVFVKMLEVLEKRAIKNPRPQNSKGLVLSVREYADLCQRHNFESKLLPKAKARGWPTVIKWGQIEGRIQRMKSFLQELIDDETDERELGLDADELDGPKTQCIFWKEALADVRAKGSSNAAAGIQNQLGSFEKTLPGYYGEMGSHIIYQALRNLYPLASFDTDTIKPLTPNSFIQQILVPEVALRLIMEDRNLCGRDGVRTAFKVLRESTSYGIAMFPEDANNSEDFNVADRIVLDRARKRRKELEKEEKVEAMMNTQNSRSRPRPRPVALTRINTVSEPHSPPSGSSMTLDFHFSSATKSTSSPPTSPPIPANRKSKIKKTESIIIDIGDSDSEAESDILPSVNKVSHPKPNNGKNKSLSPRRRGKNDENTTVLQTYRQRTEDFDWVLPSSSQ